MNLKHLFLLALIQGVATRSIAADSPPAGIRMFTCAHSFHAFVYRQVAEAALDAGIKDHVSVGLSSIGGSRVIQHWDLEDDKHQAKKALTEGKIDVLTLSPIWLPDEGIAKFAKLGLDHNPNLRITVQKFWLPNDTYEPIYPLDTRKKVDHNATVLAELKKHQDRYDGDVDDYVRAINKQLSKDVIVTVPVGQAAWMLREKIIAGQVPSLKSQSDLFYDTWGHPTHPLQILSAYCHFAIIYQRSPVGLPLARDFIRSKKLKPQWDENLNRMLQEIAWEAVTRDPMSGVKAAAK